MMFFSYSLAHTTCTTVSSQLGELLQTVPIDLPVGVMMHDFITEHYTLFMDLPLTFRLERCNGEPPYCLSQIAPVVPSPAQR